MQINYPNLFSVYFSGPCNSLYCLRHFINAYDDDDDDDDDTLTFLECITSEFV